MKALVIGGNGYVGRHFTRLSTVFTTSVLADLDQSTSDVVHCDVRTKMASSLVADGVPDWIVLMAAVHREPGHKPTEYFETNLLGARNVAAFAAEVGCKNILFLSSSSTYGSTPSGGADEQTLPCPDSPYGMSKLAAELVLESWLHESDDRRLIICRPGVIYGPGDPGNILRLIRAVKGGYFFYPGARTIRKSYAYISGLIASIDFAVQRDERSILYNYVERETETLEDLVRAIQDEFGIERRVVSIPRPMLIGVAHGLQFASRGQSPLHARRIRKAASPSYIIPRWLIDHGFSFGYDFGSSLSQWRREAPEDFE